MVLNGKINDFYDLNIFLCLLRFLPYFLLLLFLQLLWNAWTRVLPFRLLKFNYFFEEDNNQIEIFKKHTQNDKCSFFYIRQTINHLFIWSENSVENKPQLNTNHISMIIKIPRPQNTYFIRFDSDTKHLKENEKGKEIWSHKRVHVVIIISFLCHHKLKLRTGKTTSIRALSV